MRNWSRALLVAGLAAGAWIGVQAAEHAAARADDTTEHAETWTAEHGGQRTDGLGGVVDAVLGEVRPGKTPNPNRPDKPAKPTAVLDEVVPLVGNIVEVVEQVPKPVKLRAEKPVKEDRTDEAAVIAEAASESAEPAVAPASNPVVVEPAVPTAVTIGPPAPTTVSEAGPPVSASDQLPSYDEDPERPCGQPRSSARRDDDTYVPPDTSHGRRPRGQHGKAATAPLAPRPDPSPPVDGIPAPAAVSACCCHHAAPTDGLPPSSRADAELLAGSLARDRIRATLARADGIATAPA